MGLIFEGIIYVFCLAGFTFQSSALIVLSFNISTISGKLDSWWILDGVRDFVTWVLVPWFWAVWVILWCGVTFFLIMVKWSVIAMRLSYELGFAVFLVFEQICRFCDVVPTLSLVLSKWNSIAVWLFYNLGFAVFNVFELIYWFGGMGFPSCYFDVNIFFPYIPNGLMIALFILCLSIMKSFY